MGIVNLTPKGFSLGQISDLPRGELPPGAVYRMQNWIPQTDASLRRRGRWEYGSKDFGAADGVSTQVMGTCWAPFVGVDPGLLVSVTDAGKVYTEFGFSATDGTLAGGTALTMGAGPRQPFWHRWPGAGAGLGLGGIVVFPQSHHASASPHKLYWDPAAGGSYKLAALGGTPPQASVGMSWGDYLILANGIEPSDSSGHFNRMWFSGVGTPETWSTLTSFLDFPEEIIGVTSVAGLIFAFGPSGTHLVIGDTPPPGGNFTLKKFQFQQGLFDPRAVVRYKDTIIWANASGIWRSDGSTLTSITDEVGESRRWRSLLSGFFATTNNVWLSLGIWQGKLVAGISRSGSTTDYICYVFDLEAHTCYELRNIIPLSMAFAPSSINGADECFVGMRDHARIIRFAPMYDFEGQQADPEGTYIVASLETPFYKLGSAGMKRWRRLWVDYSIDGPASPSTLRVNAGRDEAHPDQYDDPVQVDLKISTDATRLQRRLPVSLGRKLKGMQFKLALTNSGSGIYDARIFGLEADATVLDPSRDGDPHT